MINIADNIDKIVLNLKQGNRKPRCSIIQILFNKELSKYNDIRIFVNRSICQNVSPSYFPSLKKYIDYDIHMYLNPILEEQICYSTDILNYNGNMRVIYSKITLPLIIGLANSISIFKNYILIDKFFKIPLTKKALELTLNQSNIMYSSKNRKLDKYISIQKIIIPTYDYEYNGTALPNTYHIYEGCYTSNNVKFIVGDSQ
jgi:hypothetical protein